MEPLLSPLFSWHWVSAVPNYLCIPGLCVHHTCVLLLTLSPPPEMPLSSSLYGSALVIIWFQLGHHLPRNAFPALRADPDPLFSDSPLLCASLWHGPTISPCGGLSTSLPHLFPPSSMSSLWADRGRVSMRPRVPQLLTCPTLSQGPDGGSSNEFSWLHYYQTEGVGRSRRHGCC